MLPRRADYAGLRTSWRGDLVAGVTVGVVALPLALAFGITTGLGAEAGLVTAIVAGLVAAVFGGSQRAGVGPDRRDDRRARARRRAVRGVDAVVRRRRSWPACSWSLGGVLPARPLSSPTSRGRWSRASPLGIAVHHLPAAGPGRARRRPSPTARTPPPSPSARSVTRRRGTGRRGRRARRARGRRDDGRRPRLHRALPASLLAVVVATVVAELAGLRRRRASARCPSVAAAPALPDVSIARRQRAALGRRSRSALLAAIESLLSAKVADGMADSGRHDPDRELFGQGLANLVVAAVRRHAGDRRDRPHRGQRPRRRAHPRRRDRPRARARCSSCCSRGVARVPTIPLAALAGVLMVTACGWSSSTTCAPCLRSTAVRRRRARASPRSPPSRSTSIVAVEIGIAVAAVLALRTSPATATSQPRAAPATRARRRRRSTRCSTSTSSPTASTARCSSAPRSGSSPSSPRSTDVRGRHPAPAQIQVLDATGAQALGEIVERARAPRHHRAAQGCPRPSTCGSSQPSAPSTASPTSATCSTTSTTPSRTPDPTSTRRTRRRMSGISRRVTGHDQHRRQEPRHGRGDVVADALDEAGPEHGCRGERTRRRWAAAAAVRSSSTSIRKPAAVSSSA